LYSTKLTKSNTFDIHLTDVLKSKVIYWIFTKRIYSAEEFSNYWISNI